MKFIVKSLRVEKYIKQVVSGHNCDFEYHPEEADRYIINCIGQYNQKYEVEIYDEDGECGSGWCTASWGHIEMRKVREFIGSTHTPIKKDLSFELKLDGNSNLSNDDVENEIFSVDYDGGDGYYPSGCITINLSLFEETLRNKQKRPVWIFYGDSGLGKTYLSSIIRNSSNGKTVYETDLDISLPNEITHDIIVVGNKYKFTQKEIEEKIIGECEVILVNFKTN